MKKLLIITIAALGSAYAADVIATFDNAGIVPMPTLGQAKAIAAGMFSEVGIQIQWVAASSRSHSPAGVPINIRMATVSDPRKKLELGHAFPYLAGGTQITLFYDAASPDAHPAILAHILAHEIGHVLQGFVRHSATGVMKPLWNGKDYFEMETRPLRFTPDDVQLFHSGLARRTPKSVPETGYDNPQR